MSKRVRNKLPKAKKAEKGVYIKKWHKQEIGSITEKKFFDQFLHGSFPIGTPSWIVSIAKHDDEMDAKGVDVLVKIRHFLGGTHRDLEIRVQLKTSSKYIDQFKLKHPTTRIAILVIPLAMKARDFLPLFYKLVRDERYWLAQKMNLLPYLSSEEDIREAA